MRPPLVYIAGPYRSKTPWGVEQNIRAAEAVAYRVAELGGYPVCPHANTRGYFEGLSHPAEFWSEATLKLMFCCEAIVMVKGWASSSGATAELAAARRWPMKVFLEEDLKERDDAASLFSAWLDERALE